jgi:primosomal protein N' (replication factor Y)
VEQQAKDDLNYISDVLEKAIMETLDAGRQVMLFINRRGHSPIVQCRKCGWVASCPDCSCGLHYHKKSGGLLCHVCGRTMNLPKKCPDCGGEISFMGAGIEKIEEEILLRFPNARTALVSSDTTQNVGALENLIKKMENGEIDIIIGTQILAKGHHFPNLTLVGVIDSDMGLFGTDFRAAEKTFQQLFQVSGRAGRGNEVGRVLLQTYQPEHPVIKALAENNRDDFTAKDLENRRLAKMPPFGQLIAVIVEHQRENVLIDFCNQLKECAPVIISTTPSSPNGDATPSQAKGNGKILGPIPAELYQVRNWFRMRFLVSGDENAALQPAVRSWLAKVRQPSGIRIKIDVSPQSFL